MSGRTPTLDGLTVAPNEPQEVQSHRYWGRYDTAAELPNAASNSASGASFDALRPGDIGVVDDGGGNVSVYYCVDPGTSGGTDADWQRLTAGSPIVLALDDNEEATDQATWTTMKSFLFVQPSSLSYVTATLRGSLWRDAAITQAEMRLEITDGTTTVQSAAVSSTDLTGNSAGDTAYETSVSLTTLLTDVLCECRIQLQRVGGGASDFAHLGLTEVLAT